MQSNNIAVFRLSHERNKQQRQYSETNDHLKVLNHRRITRIEPPISYESFTIEHL